jgi:GNAT superfamily N-acetyltransferase
MPELIFVKAETDDIRQIIQVVNTAYRGETSKLGWTTEADLLDGLRTDEKELLQLLADEASFILLCKLRGKVLGSVHLQNMGDCVEIGMFAVNPLHQGLGIGKQLLQHAEMIAVETWSIQRLQMAVISCRYELLAFYNRRGYLCNGGTKAFPENPLLWTPKVKNLKFTLLEKTL